MRGRCEPLNVGRKTRSIPPSLRHALNARDRARRFPGCANTRYVDAHHIQHWARGGETRLSNLVHHRQVHEGRVVIERLDDGLWAWDRGFAPASPTRTERFRGNALIFGRS
jgi:hypothetical protein